MQNNQNLPKYAKICKYARNGQNMQKISIEHHKLLGPV